MIQYDEINGPFELCSESFNSGHRVGAYSIGFVAYRFRGGAVVSEFAGFSDCSLLSINFLLSLANFNDICF